MRLLLLSAYAAASHAYWARQLIEHIEGDWTLLELAPRHFSWRIRGNPLSWALREDATLSQRFDVVMATSMVDLATLIGLYPHLGQALKVMYFHENQFAYPASPAQSSPAEARMVNLYAALCADRVVFNTLYNRDSFIDGARAWLKRMPENLPATTSLERLRRASLIIPVPIIPLYYPSNIKQIPSVPDRQPARRPLRVLWNHRWEYDKNPDDFFAALFQLSDAGVAFELAVVGQQFRKCPDIFTLARKRLSNHLVAWGEQSADAYTATLMTADIVVSTTHHEFQGLAIMEAVQCGACPLVPDRLCFPELYEPAYRYDGSFEGLIKSLGRWLQAPDTMPSVPDTEAWEWPAWKARYRALLHPAS